jgi:hypothetical protein
VCRSDAGAFFNRTDQCNNFKKHEGVMLTGYSLNTPQWSESVLKGAISGINAKVLPDSELQHNSKTGRAYFTDPSLPDFQIWGETSCQDGLIQLADTNLKSGVLCHEFGHVFMGCGMNDHQLMATNGVDAATRYVENNYTPDIELTGATGSSGLYALPVKVVHLMLPNGNYVTGTYDQ